MKRLAVEYFAEQGDYRDGRESRKEICVKGE
jgi:hypothetical protein